MKPITLTLLLLALVACNKPQAPQPPSPFHATDTLGKRLEVVAGRYSRMVDSAGRPLMDWRLVGVQDDRCQREYCSFCRRTYVTAAFEVIVLPQSDTLNALQLLTRGCVQSNFSTLFADTVDHRLWMTDLYPWPDTTNTTTTASIPLEDYKAYVLAYTLCAVFPDSCSRTQ